jgi:hypothetical protein
MVFTFGQEREIEKYLEKELSPYFKDFESELLKSDEIGHTHGPKIQKEVGILLSKKYNVKYELDKKGKPKKRAFSDNIIEENYNNVKFGISVGGPNLVAMNKMVKNVNDNNLMCYYTTFVHYDIIKKTIKVRFVNILQFTDCLSYNGGPGQIMVQQAKFNSEYEKYVISQRPNFDSKKMIKEINLLYVSGMEKHIILKSKQLQKHKEKYSN